MGTSGDDFFEGTVKKVDVAVGLAGNDDFYIDFGGRDFLCGDSGNDELFGAADRDGLRGGAGDDELRSGSFDGAIDLLIGGAGTDTCFADTEDTVKSCETVIYPED